VPSWNPAGVWALAPVKSDATKAETADGCEVRKRMTLKGIGKTGKN
jgi:hypothetical protein